VLGKSASGVADRATLDKFLMSQELLLQDQLLSKDTAGFISMVLLIRPATADRTMPQAAIRLASASYGPVAEKVVQVDPDETLKVCYGDLKARELVFDYEHGEDSLSELLQDPNVAVDDVTTLKDYLELELETKLDHSVKQKK